MATDKAAPDQEAGTITVETTVPTSDIAAFYEIYWESWQKMLDTSPCRQYLRFEEFAAEATDARVLKFILWGEGGQPVALAFVARELSVVPWVAPEFYAARFPTHYNERRIFYVGSIVVHPSQRHSHAIRALLRAITLHMVEVRGIAAFDCSQYMYLKGWHEMIASVGHMFSDLEAQDLGEPQHYFAYVVNGPKMSIAAR
jgi:hypothetical protein